MDDGVFFFGVYFQKVVCVDIYERVLIVVKVISIMIDIKVEDIDGIYFFNFRVELI